MSEKEPQEKPPEIVSDSERDLAQNATAEFKKKNYSLCLQSINKLETVRPNDFKVVHNKAVAQYLESDLKKTDEFEKNLRDICNKFDIKDDKLEEIDYGIAQFNHAVVLFHQKQYTNSQNIMDMVYKYIEPMEESLVKQVSLLAIELQLCFRRPERALQLIGYLENNLMYGGSISLKKLDEKEKKLPSPKPKSISEDFQKKLSQYKVRCHLLNRSLTAASKMLSDIFIDKTNLELVFLAANLEYLKGNLNESFKILLSIPEDSLDNYREYGESFKVMLNNNMGILHHALGKHHLACFYFQTALKEDIRIYKAMKRQGRNDNLLYTLGGSKYHEIMYNLGISLLYAGKAETAFDCMIVCLRRYHRNSRLWLRIAECCIAVHKKSNEEDFDFQKKQNELISEVIGNGDLRKIILTSNLSKDKKYNTESQSSAIPVPSLEFAVLCLRNAFLLIPDVDAGDTLEEPLFVIPGTTPAPPPSHSLSPSSPPGSHGIQTLKNSILVASAYVYLCLGDYITALRYSKELLAQQKVCGAHKLLAHLYAAECLISSDNFTEAMEHLDPTKVEYLSFNIPPSSAADLKTNPPPKWFPNNVENAHVILRYNLAVAKAIRGQLVQAGELLKQIWQQRTATCQVPAHIIMLVIYIELKLGHAEIAKNLLRQHSSRHLVSR
ncbi:unnamed protein product [Ceutorhynchus assimilis]|uniref:CCR4-NOT transcription complex subunit 10 n=1 Tax=Ceutorhynchus assimilis TaxID=467358 RepID=A0A9N9MKM3_9CUCU|nr:unnamed protein product [Ceutorhynchus assimilis]